MLERQTRLREPVFKSNCCRTKALSILFHHITTVHSAITYVKKDIMQVNTDIAHEMLSCTLLHISSIGRSSVMVGPTQYVICRFISRSTNFAWIIICDKLNARIPCMLAGGQELTLLSVLAEVINEPRQTLSMRTGGVVLFAPDNL